MSKHNKIILILILIIFLTACNKETEYSTNDKAKLKGTIVNKDNKSYLNLEEPIIIDGEEVKQIELESNTSLKSNKQTTIDGKITKSKDTYIMEIENIEDILVYVNTYSNDKFSFTIPTSIINLVYIEEIDNGFIIYSYDNLDVGGEVLTIKSITSSEYKKLQKDKNIIVERITSNKEQTIVALLPTTEEYSEEHANEYEQIGNQISKIKKSVKIK